MLLQVGRREHQMQVHSNLDRHELATMELRTASSSHSSSLCWGRFLLAAFLLSSRAILEQKTVGNHRKTPDAVFLHASTPVPSPSLRLLR